MNYVERLIQRAVAPPRRTVQVLFDPFEQTGFWAPENATTTRTSQSPAAVAMPDAQAPGAPQNGMPLSAAVLQQPGGHAVVEKTVVQNGPALQPPTVAVAAGHPETKIAHTAGPDGDAPSPLAKADAFMRGLGVNTPASKAQATAHSAAPGLPNTTIAASRTERDSQTQAPKEARPQLVMPVRPPVIPPQGLPPRPSPEAAQSRRKPDTDPAPRRTTPATSLQPAATRTVIVAAPAVNRLDDLAHGSAISRFGLGQG